MSKRVLAFWKSDPVSIFVTSFAFLTGSILRLVDYAFGVPEILQSVSRGLLIVAAMFFLVSLFKDRLFLSNEGVYRAMAKRYGIGYGELQVECRIESDGSAQVRRTVTIEAFGDIDQLDTFMAVQESDPAGKPRTTDNLDARSLTEGYTVLAKHKVMSDKTLSTVLEISPPLSEGKFCKYELVQHLPVGLFVVSEEPSGSRKTPYDYFGWNINRPSRKLFLKVLFPINISLTPFDPMSEVRYASVAPGLPTDHRHDKEQRRIPKPLLMGRHGDADVLQLDVKYPIDGLVYILRWQPLVAASGQHGTTTQPNVGGQQASTPAGNTQSERRQSDIGVRTGEIRAEDRVPRHPITSPNDQMLAAQESLLNASPIDKTRLTDVHRTKLRQYLEEHFNEGELRTLSFDLKVDYDNLPRGGKADMVRELIEYLERHRQLAELIDWVKQNRPEIHLT